MYDFVAIFPWHPHTGPHCRHSVGLFFNLFGPWRAGSLSLVSRFGISVPNFIRLDSVLEVFKQLKESQSCRGSEIETYTDTGVKGHLLQVWIKIEIL